MQLHHHTHRSQRGGFTLTELLVCVVVVTTLVTLFIPLLGAGRSRSRELKSLSNLKTLAGAHAAYGKDWGDRQFTNMPDNMAQSGGIFSNYYSQFGCPPSIVLGYGGSYPGSQGPGLWGYWAPAPCSNIGLAGNFPILWPMQFGSVGGTGSQGFGMWRLQNAVGFNEYVNGRFMDATFYAPADLLAMEQVGPGLESPNPFTYFQSGGDGIALSSYCASPAAMFHPGVFGGDADHVFKSPYTFTEASVSPTVSQCANPDLKTRLSEYYWLQAPPPTAWTSSPGTMPFNLGADSVPMTMFFDGHTAALPVRKVLADNAAVVKGGGAKLWMDTEITEGPWAGYEGFYSFVSVDDTRTSFHVFTREGILGRDCLTAP